MMNCEFRISDGVIRLLKRSLKAPCIKVRENILSCLIENDGYDGRF